MSASEPGRIRRLLVANRGEIAVRVLRTCRRLGIEGVLTVTDADARSLPARLADRVVRVPNYLDVDAVVTAVPDLRRPAPRLRLPLGEPRPCYGL